LDIFLAPIVLPLHALNIKFVMASAQILSDQDEFVAPLDMYIIPDESDASKKEIEAIWSSYLESKKTAFGAYVDLLKKIAIQHHFDFERYFYWSKSIVPFGFDFPELIFWDRCFDFPRSVDKIRNKHYLGNQVFTDIVYNSLYSFDSSFQRLIYVSLGSKDRTLLKLKIIFYQKIIEISKRHVDTLYVMSVPKEFLVDISVERYSNIQFFNYSPQLEILKHASLMITHGGGSIKECIRFGVPMLCYPIDNDQYGNTARVAYHKLGLVGDIHSDSETKIENDICRLLNSDKYVEGLFEFQKRAIAAENGIEDILLIEELMNSSSNNA